MMYILPALLFLAISPGVTVMQRLLADGDDPGRGWIMFLPSTAIYLIGLYFINNRILVPRILLSKGLGRYFGVSALVTLMLTLAVVYIERGVTLLFDLPCPVDAGSPGWLMAEAVSNALFVFPLMVGFALLNLYNKLRDDMDREQQIAWRLEEYIAVVREDLNPHSIIVSLKEIANLIATDPDGAAERIVDLSERLRSILAELAPPPVIKVEETDRYVFSRATAFVADKRWRITRHLLMLTVLLFVSLMASGKDFLTDPAAALLQSAMLFIYLSGITYLTLLLFRRQMRRNNLNGFFLREWMLTVVAVSPVLLAIPVIFIETVAKSGLTAALLEIPALGAGMAVIAAYLWGFSALLLFQNWIRVHRRITVLRAETVRQQYLFLRKQINPHFLFNVLNNIDICIADDPRLATALLHDLTTLLQFQFREMHHEYLTLKSEMEFLRSYLSLEQSRRTGFTYRLAVDCDAAEVSIPSLLLIPVIENAVKYSCSRPGYNNVLGRFTLTGGMLRCECVNPYDPAAVSRLPHHGIGLSNLRHRLELLYEGRARLTVSQTDQIYSLTLIIPVK